LCRRYHEHWLFVAGVAADVAILVFQEVFLVLMVVFPSWPELPYRVKNALGFIIAEAVQYCKVGYCLYCCLPFTKNDAFMWLACYHFDFN
jgi:hypothetical protein